MSSIFAGRRRRTGLGLLAFVSTLLAVAHVAGDGERSEPKPLREATSVRAGDAARADADGPDTRATVAVPVDPPIVGDLGDASLRAWIEQRATAVEDKRAAPLRKAAPADPPSTRRIEFETPEVHIVNPTSRWVFIPNPDKMGPRPQDDNP